MTCADESTRAGESLAGTAARAERWLLVEHDGAWGRDAIEDTTLPHAARQAAAGFGGRVLLIRARGRRGRQGRDGLTVFEAETTESGGDLSRQVLGAGNGSVYAREEERVIGPLVLVCTHGRRDACCARLGPPAYEALRTELGPDRVWQSSHQGGHRFAANVLVLPWGVQLGRVSAVDAPAVAASLTAGRVPLEHYRGRTLYDPPVQAAEIAVRQAHGLDELDGLRLVEARGESVRFGTPLGEIEVLVEARGGPVVRRSCGVEPAPTVAFDVRVQSAA